MSDSTVTNGIHHSGAGLPASLNMTEPCADRIRIVLIEEHTILRQALQMFFKPLSDFEIVGEASDRAGAIDAVSRAQPGIILLAASVGEASDYKIIRQMLASAEQARVIILSGERDVRTQRNAIALGAKGVVPKQCPVETLIKAVKKVYAGEIWLERTTTASLIAEIADNADSNRLDPEIVKMNSLSRREREVVALVATGLKNRQVAERLFITEATVSHHLTSIFNKLDISDRLQLIIYTHKHGLIRPGF